MNCLESNIGLKNSRNKLQVESDDEVHECKERQEIADIVQIICVSVYIRTQLVEKINELSCDHKYKDT